MAENRTPPIPIARLRDEYVEMRTKYYGFADLYAEEFDRSLAAHDAELRAEVERLRAGIERIADECAADIPADPGNATARHIAHLLRAVLDGPDERSGGTPSVDDMAGALGPDWTGGLSSVDFVRSQRDDSPAPPAPDSPDVREAAERVTAYLDEMDRVDAANRAGSRYDDTVHGINDLNLRRSDLRAVLAVVGQGVTGERTITLPRPVVPRGPDVREAENDWTANYLWEAARRIGDSRMFGSRLTETVSDLLAAASHAVREDKPVDDGRPAADTIEKEADDDR